MKILDVVTRAGAWDFPAPAAPAQAAAPATAPTGRCPAAPAAAADTPGDATDDIDGPLGVPVVRHPWPRTPPKRSELLEPHQVAWLRDFGIAVE